MASFYFYGRARDTNKHSTSSLTTTILCENLTTRVIIFPETTKVLGFFRLGVSERKKNYNSPSRKRLIFSRLKFLVYPQSPPTIGAPCIGFEVASGGIFEFREVPRFCERERSKRQRNIYHLLHPNRRPSQVVYYSSLWLRLFELLPGFASVGN